MAQGGAHDRRFRQRGIEFNGSGAIAITGTDTTRTLTLAGSAAGNVLALTLGNATTAATSLAKMGAGAWNLTGNNSYTGSTSISGGTFTLSGANGAIAGTSGIALGPATLTLDNTTGSGGFKAGRLKSTGNLTVDGKAAFNFTHGAVAAHQLHRQCRDLLVLDTGHFTYTGTQGNNPTTGQSIFTFGGLSHPGTATANFTGTGLGTNARNWLKFTGQSTGADIGPWAVVNGADFATYDATNFVKAAANSTLAAGWKTGAATNFKMTGGGITITASLNPSYKTLLISDTAGGRTLALNGNAVKVGGISITGQTHIISGTKT